MFEQNYSQNHAIIMQSLVSASFWLLRYTSVSIQGTLSLPLSNFRISVPLYLTIKRSVFIAVFQCICELRACHCNDLHLGSQSRLEGHTFFTVWTLTYLDGTWVTCKFNQLEGMKDELECVTSLVPSCRGGRSSSVLDSPKSGEWNMIGIRFH